MPTSKTRLLIIDDQPTSVGLLLAYLGDSNIDLLVALDGEDGLRIANEGHPDLILLDVQMPGIDGFAVCRRLKASTPTARIPVIFLSAAIDTEDKLRGFAAGGADYITKPFSEQEVLARVFVQLGERRELESLIAESGADPADMPPAAYAERRDRRLLSDAVALLTRHLTDPPSLVDLAHRVGTNQQRLTLIFR